MQVVKHRLITLIDIKFNSRFLTLALTKPLSFIFLSFISWEPEYCTIVFSSSKICKQLWSKCLSNIEYNTIQIRINQIYMNTLLFETSKKQRCEFLYIIKEYWGGKIFHGLLSYFWIFWADNINFHTAF